MNKMVSALSHEDIVSLALRQAIRVAGSLGELAKLLKLKDRRIVHNWVRRKKIPAEHVPAVALVANWKEEELYPPSTVRLVNLRRKVARLKKTEAPRPK